MPATDRSFLFPMGELRGQTYALSARLDHAEYLAGYLAGVGILDTRIHYAQFEPHYLRGFIAGVVGLCFGVDLSGGVL